MLIKLETLINAPISTVFNCSRDIDLHKHSMLTSGEEAIDGVTSGLINLNETVTWRARHFGIYFKLSTKITSFDFPYSFKDEMISGPFKLMKHLHKFEEKNGQTLMSDEFEYEAPAGWIGKLVEKFILNSYMKNMLEERNRHIKMVAERA